MAWSNSRYVNYIVSAESPTLCQHIAISARKRLFMCFSTTVCNSHGWPSSLTYVRWLGNYLWVSCNSSPSVATASQPSAIRERPFSLSTMSVNHTDRNVSSGGKESAIERKTLTSDARTISIFSSLGQIVYGNSGKHEAYWIISLPTTKLISTRCTNLVQQSPQMARR